MGHKNFKQLLYEEKLCLIEKDFHNYENKSHEQTIFNVIMIAFYFINSMEPKFN